MHISRTALTLSAVGVLATALVVGNAAGVPQSFAAAGSHATRHQTGTVTPAARHADGQITAISGNTITVAPDNDQAGSNEYTAVTSIVLTATTKYQSGHDAAATTTKPTFAVGQHIVAEGNVSADGKTLTATLVSVDNHGPGGPGGHGPGGAPHADGTVTSVNGNTIGIKADADQAGSNEYTAVTTILLTATTQYDAGHDQAATTTKPTIAVGNNIMAEGTLSNNGATLTATRVSVRPAGAGGKH